MERRRLKTVAGELERAFEEVRTRAAETEESRLRADKARTEALEASEAAKKEKGTLQLRCAQVRHVEHWVRRKSKVFAGREYPYCTAMRLTLPR